MTATELPYGDVPGQTHWDGCWRARGHHNCAVREIDRLRAAPREPGEGNGSVEAPPNVRHVRPHRSGCGHYDCAAPRPDAGDGTGEP